MTTNAEASSYQRLRKHLWYLRLTTAAEQLSAELDRALRDKLSPTQVLEHLLELYGVAGVAQAPALAARSGLLDLTRRWPTSTSSPRWTAAWSPTSPPSASSSSTAK